MLIQQREYFAKLCCQTTFGSAPAVSLLKLTTKGKRNSAGRVSVEATKFLKSSSFQHLAAQFASQQPEKKREAPLSCKFGCKFGVWRRRRNLSRRLVSQQLETN